MIFQLEENKMEVEVIYRKRKTISIQVDINGEVKVIAPHNVTQKRILEILDNNKLWINKKINEMKKLSSKKVIRTPIEGEKYLYLGKNYSVKINLINTKKITININGENLVINTYTKEEETLKLALEKWYREKTLELAIERINNYKHLFKDKVRYIKVKEQKKRWASCTGNNDILFNWRLSMAPLEVFDYIVIHEMCHMEHRNHGKYFWKAVYNIMPNYKESEKYLKENGMNLSI